MDGYILEVEQLESADLDGVTDLWVIGTGHVLEEFGVPAYKVVARQTGPDLAF